MTASPQSAVENSTLQSLLQHLDSIPRGKTPAAVDPTVQLRLYIPNSNRAWYVVSWDENDEEIFFDGYEIEAHFADRYPDGEIFTYSFLRQAAKIVGSSVEVDETFMPQPLSVVSAVIT